MQLRNVRFYFLAFVVILLLAGCKRAENIFPADAEGSLVSYSGCNNARGEQNTAGSLTAQKVQECIEYQYNGKNTLLLSHLNATFNCCPGTILAETTFSEGLISITEWETEHGCRCVCDYNLDYRFYNIPPGVYTIRLSTERGVTFEYTINLNVSHSGSKCWDR